MMPGNRRSAEQIRIVRERAECGIPEAQYNLGRFFAAGRGVEKDPFTAAGWWLKAAEQGHAEARRKLRALVRADASVARDDPALARWWHSLELANAEAGDDEAQSWLGEMCWRGLGRSQDATAAVEWWRRAARQGHQIATLKLRLCRAENGDTDEQFALGKEFLHGEHGAGQQSKGLAWLRKAARAGHLDAMLKLGRLRLSGPQAMRDRVEGGRLLMAAASSGNKRALAEFGRLFKLVWPVARTTRVTAQESIRCLRSAAETGQAEACHQIGSLYLHGVELTQDAAAAHGWMLKAARAEHRDAQYIVGCMYQHGHGVGLDEDEARKWLESAANSGHAHAQTKLGWLTGRPGQETPWE